MARVTLHLSGIDATTLRKILAACSENRESFTSDISGEPRWAPRVSLEGPDLFGAHVAPCPPSLAALLATIVDKT